MYHTRNEKYKAAVGGYAEERELRLSRRRIVEPAHMNPDVSCYGMFIDGPLERDTSCIYACVYISYISQR